MFLRDSLRMFSHLSHLNALSLITGLFADISDELIRFFYFFSFSFSNFLAVGSVR